MGETIAARFGAALREPIEPPTIDEIDLREPRVAPPDSLAHLCTIDPEERAGHTYGKSFRDIWRGLHRDFSQPPDLVAIPRDEHDIVSLLDWCSDARIAAIPYGGGSSVVGGVECDIDDDYGGAVSIDLRALDQVVEVDRGVARGARAGRHLRPGARRPAPAARPHPAPLPAVVRVLDARRLARDPLRRSLRDAAHAHRRLRRVDPGGHAPRRVGEPAPARLGRGPVARPHAARLGGHARRHHRGVDAPPGPADVPRVGHRALLDVHAAASKRRARSRSRASTRPTAACSTRSKRNSPAPTTAATRCCCSRSSRPITRSTRGSPGRSSARSTTARGSTTTRSSIRSDGTEGAREGAAGSWRNAFVRAPYTRDAIVGVGHDQRDVRDRVHVGSLRGAARGRHDRGARHRGGGGRVAGSDHLPVHARVPRRSGAVLHRARGRQEGEQLAQWEAIKAAAGDAHHPIGRHDHAPPRRRARSPPGLRPPAPRAVRGRAARREARDRSRGDPQSRAC